jgi:hypothetical protein
MLGRSDSPNHPTGECDYDMLWRIAIGDLSISNEAMENPRQEASARDAECYQLWRDRCYPKGTSSYRMSLSKVETQKVEAFETKARRLCFSMKRCLTQKGRVGHVPRVTSVDDVISIPLGGDTPFILRPRCGRYEIIGPCYIQGLMRVRSLNVPQALSEFIEIV